MWRKLRVQNIISELINDSFTDLKKLQIQLIKSKDKDEFLACAGTRQSGHKIYFTKSIDKLSNNELKGVAAHELCHIEKMNAWHPLLVILESFCCRVLPFFDSYMERKTDRRVVQKGYGENLLAFQKYHDRKYEPYTKYDGLTKKEIKQLLRKYDLTHK